MSKTTIYKKDGRAILAFYTEGEDRQIVEGPIQHLLEMAHAIIDELEVKED
jgi:hypothetical protein